MVERSAQSGGGAVLIYDGQCRLCVTAQQGLDRLQSRQGASPVRLIPYQSEEARCLLGDRYRPGRPDVAFLVDGRGEVTGGLDAFLPLLQGVKGGRLLAAVFQHPLVKPLGYRIYGWVAKYRYRLFGSVPVRPSPSSRSESAPPESR